MTAEDADRRAEMPDATPDGSGRNPQEHGLGASNVTAMKDHSHPEPMRQAATQTYITNRRGTEPYARWCGRTAGVTPPPTRFPGYERFVHKRRACVLAHA